MRRWLPFLRLYALLLLMWLALNQSVSVAQLLLGALVAGAAVLALSALQAPTARATKAGLVLELIALVLADVVRSNLAVAVIVLRPGIRSRQAGFVHVPLELRNAAGLAALGCIITATPGAAWAGYDAGTGMLTIHVLDLVDEQTWIRTIRDRYGRRLRAIYE
jgi:multicomponent K+:H+ antiporter subunit E